MAFQAVPDTAEIDMIFTMNGVAAQNVFYAELSGGYVKADLEALAAQIDLQWDGTWKVNQPAEVSYLRTEVRGLALENDLVVTDATSAGVGTHIGNITPNNVTFAIKKESGLSGRSARGRTYWIGIPTGELLIADENQLKSAYITLIVDAVDDIRQGIVALTGWQPVLVSRFQNSAKRSVGVTFPWISSINVDTRIDTQRGRLP